MAAIVNERWAVALREWESWCLAGGMATSTIAVRRSYLARFAAANPNPWTVTLPDCVALVGTPSWAAETRRQARGSLRCFYTYAIDYGHVEKDPTAKLPAIRVPGGTPRPVPSAVFTTALSDADDQRRLLLLLAGYAGLRCAEIAALRWSDICDGRLHVTGKGGRQRVIPIHPSLAAELDAEHDRRRAGRFGSGWRYARWRDDALTYVFPGQSGGPYLPPSIGKIAKRALGAAWSAHSLRHRFASAAYATDRDLFAVQELLGHSKPETTRRYVQTPPGALERAVWGAGRAST